MRIRRTQIALGAVFVAALLVIVGCLVYALLAKKIYADDLQALTIQVLAVYSVPLGIIVGGIFGGSAKPSGKGRTYTFWIALILSLLWNALLVFRSSLFAIADQDSTIWLKNYFETVAAAGTFLIGAALAYYFAK